jgi:hypothetical protein
MDILKLAEQAGFGMIYRRNENGDMVLHSCAEVDMVKLQALLDLIIKENEELRYKVLDLKKRLKALYQDDDRQTNQQQDRGDC